MLKFIPMGIVQHMLEFHTWMHFKTDIYISSSEPAVLSMDDVAFGFYICMGTCGLSIIAFVVEIGIIKAKRRIEKFIENFVTEIFQRWLNMNTK